MSTNILPALPILAFLIAPLLAGCASGAPPPPAATPDVPATIAAAVNATVAARVPAAPVTPTRPAPSTPTKPAPPPTAAKTSPGASRANPLPLPASASSDEWKIEITGVKRGAAANAAIAAANQFNDPPRKGYEYVLVSTRLTNIAKKQEPQGTLFAWNMHATGERNISYSQASVVTPKRYQPQLLPGGATEGDLAFAVAADEKNVMLAVLPAFSFTDNTVYVAVDNGASLKPDPAVRQIAPTAAGAQRSAPANLNEAMVTAGWQLTVTGFMRGLAAAQAITTANPFNNPAKPEYEYALVRIAARYLGAADPDALGSLDSSNVRIYGSKGVIYESPGVVAPEPRLDGRAYAGGAFEGWVSLQVAKGEASLVVTIQPQLLAGPADRFVLVDTTGR